VKPAALRDIDLPSQRRRKGFKLTYDRNVRQQGRPLRRIELNHDVDITVGGVLVARNRTKYSSVQNAPTAQVATQVAQERDDSIESTLT
jgi:hypothetical protein